MRKSIAAAVLATSAFTASAAHESLTPEAILNNPTPLSELKLPDLFLQASALRCSALGKAPQGASLLAFMNKRSAIIERAENVQREMLAANLKKYLTLANDPAVTRQARERAEVVASAAAALDMILRTYPRRTCDRDNYFGEHSPLTKSVDRTEIEQALKDPKLPSEARKIIEALAQLDPVKVERAQAVVKETHADGLTTSVEILKIIKAQNDVRGVAQSSPAIDRIAKNILDAAGLPTDAASINIISQDILHRSAMLGLAMDMQEPAPAPKPLSPGRSNGPI